MKPASAGRPRPPSVDHTPAGKAQARGGGGGAIAPAQRPSCSRSTSSNSSMRWARAARPASHRPPTGRSAAAFLEEDALDGDVRRRSDWSAGGATSLQPERSMDAKRRERRRRGERAARGVVGATVFSSACPLRRRRARRADVAGTPSGELRQAMLVPKLGRRAPKRTSTSWPPSRGTQSPGWHTHWAAATRARRGRQSTMLEPFTTRPPRPSPRARRRFFFWRSLALRTPRLGALLELADAGSGGMPTARWDARFGWR